MASLNDKYLMYVYNMPYAERKKLCNILDLNNKWEELGGMYMKFDVATLQRLGQAVCRNQSPTDELLSLWGTQNHTVIELFVLLSKMNHYQAMTILKPLVDPKYHRLIYEGEENFSRLFATERDLKSSGTEDAVGGIQAQHKSQPIHQSGKDLGYGSHNLNVPTPSAPPASVKVPVSLTQESKVLNVAPLQQEAKELNLPQSSHRKLSNGSIASSASAEACTPQITYAELEASTNGWDRSTVIGKGGFGTVFRGTWRNTQVAIKRLDMQKGPESEESLEAQRQQSLTELKYLNSCRHDNILPLYGYSVGGPYPCIVCQFMPNGSLEDRLLCRQGTQPLNWAQRCTIATGTARGLQFLHGVGDKPLVHGDIKSANILLGPYLEPRIGDFGLVREGPLQQYTHVKLSRIHGTGPYLPHEFLRGYKLSTKVDTYSFGIVLFELATGLRAREDARPQKLLKEFVEGLSESEVGKVMDSKGGADDGLTFQWLITLGKLCTKHRAKERPEMVVVLQQLDKLQEIKHNHNRAHHLARRNSLTPTTPYEIQLLHDHISQQRKPSSPSSNVEPMNGVALNNNPFIYPACPAQQQLSPLVIAGGSDTPAPAVSPHIAITPPSNSDFSALLPRLSSMEDLPPLQLSKNNVSNGLGIGQMASSVGDGPTVAMRAKPKPSSEPTGEAYQNAEQCLPLLSELCIGAVSSNNSVT